MNNVTTTSEGGLATVAFEGSMTVESAEELKNELLQVLEGHDEVNFDWTSLERADISFFQILAAAVRSGGKAKKTIRLTEETAEDVRRELELSGLTDFFKEVPKWRNE